MNYANGTTLLVRRGLLYEHFGIAGDGKVIHNSIETGVIKLSLSKFANGGQIEAYNKITSENLSLAYENAKSSIGISYDFFLNNCEHFVNYVHGKERNCEQIQRAVITMGGVAFTYITNKNMSPVLRILTGGAIGALIYSEDPTRGAVEGAVKGFAIGIVIGGGAVFLCWLLSQQ